MITPYGELPDRLAADMSMAERHDWLTRPINRRTALKTGFVTAAAVAVPAIWTQPSRAAAPRIFGRVLSYGPDPTSQMVLGFASADPIGHATVRAVAGNHQISVDSVIQGVFGTTTRYGRAHLNSLSPGTTYSYTVVIDGASAGQGSFRTAEINPTSLRFTAFGDQGRGPTQTGLLRKLLSLQPDLHLFAGDLSYADANGMGGPGGLVIGEWDGWLRQNEIATAGMPWMFAMGNHEMESGYSLHGYAGVLTRVPFGGSSPLAVPTATTYRIGPVGFIGLDSNDVSFETPANRNWTSGAQTIWLDSTLAALRGPNSGIDFIVVYLHHSAYSTSGAHGSEGGVRQAWVPLFDKYKVDLVIAGHNHCYERTLPLRAGQIVSMSPTDVRSDTGTTYATAGGGGAAASTSFTLGSGRVATADGPVTEQAPWSLPDRTAQHAFLCVDLIPAARLGDTASLHLRAFDANGAKVDEAFLRRVSGVVHAGSSGNGRLAVEIGAAAALAAGGLALWRPGKKAWTAADEPEAKQ